MATHPSIIGCCSIERLSLCIVWRTNEGPDYFAKSLEKQLVGESEAKKNGFSLFSMGKTEGCLPKTTLGYIASVPTWHRLR
jgi:hypothetical protein